MLSLHVVPELRPGEDGISLENTHSVELGIGVLLRSEGSSDDKELFQLKEKASEHIRVRNTA